ncbi:putative capsid [uncultured virus]|uniref:Putative capsid n=1 Tax=uncultured virus TaxID=340016 RepID=A0A2K9LSL0_9VIRU|nr:putative capsid [uncultured virus]
MSYALRTNRYGLSYWKPVNPLYSGGGGYATRRVPGFYRTPSRSVYTRRLRRGLYRGGRSANSVKGLLRKAAEQKYMDITIGADNGNITPNSGVIFGITENIVQNTSKSGRVGDKVTLTSLELRGRVDCTIASPNLQNDIGTVRLVVFKWYDDAAPTWADIFDVQDVDGAISGQFAPHLPFNHDKKVKRKVLFDKICTVSQALAVIWTGSGTQTGQYPNTNSRCLINNFIDLKRKGDRVRDVHFSADGASAVGHIYVAFCSEAPTNTMRLYLHVRTNYTDV